MVSTLGALTGIAAATIDRPTVLLAGMVVIAVESISMSVGSYLSNKSERDVHKRMIHEERAEIRDDIVSETRELVSFFVADGWPQDLAQTMAEHAAQSPDLMLKEMSYRELKVPEAQAGVIWKALCMFVSYVIGGAIPLLPYFFVPLAAAIGWSISITLLGLFILGAATTIFSRRNWLKAGLHMVVLAGIAAAIGYLVGQLVA